MKVVYTRGSKGKKLYEKIKFIEETVLLTDGIEDKEKTDKWRKEEIAKLHRNFHISKNKGKQSKYKKKSK